MDGAGDEAGLAPTRGAAGKAATGAALGTSRVTRSHRNGAGLGARAPLTTVCRPTIRGAPARSSLRSPRDNGAGASAANRVRRVAGNTRAGGAASTEGGAVRTPAGLSSRAGRLEFRWVVTGTDQPCPGTTRLDGTDDHAGGAMTENISPAAPFGAPQPANQMT